MSLEQLCIVVLEGPYVVVLTAVDNVPRTAVHSGPRRAVRIGPRRAVHNGRLTSAREPPGTRFESEAGWAQDPVWAICRREKTLAPTGRSSRSPVAIPSELHRLQDAVCNITCTDSPPILVFRFETL